MVNNEAAQSHIWEYINRNQASLLDSHWPFICSALYILLYILIAIVNITSTVNIILLYFILYSPESPQESSIDGDKKKVSPVSGGYTAGQITKITNNIVIYSTHHPLILDTVYQVSAT